MRSSGLATAEVTYMENYGQILTAERPEFRDRHFRCAYGVVKCGGLQIEALLFPSEGHLQEFMEVIGDDPWWVPFTNVTFHFTESDPVIIGRILEAISQKK
jgi:hypothetical protein